MLNVQIAPSATIAPKHPILDAGDDVTFTATATGTQPLAYQWKFKGVDIVNATGSSLTVSNVQPSDAGNYDVVVTNTVGAVKLNANLVVSTPTLAEALDATNLVWTTSKYEGFPAWFGQTNVSLNGSAAAISYYPDWPMTGWIQADVTGPGNLSFSWKIDAFDLSGYPYPVTRMGFLKLVIDETNQVAEVLGREDWATELIAIPPGSHSVRWTYTGSAYPGFAAWVDQVTYAEGVPVIVRQPTNQTVIAGDAVNFRVSAAGHNLNYQWKFNGSDIPGATSSVLTLASPQPLDAGFYSVSISNDAGATNSQTATLIVNAVPPQIGNQSANVYVEVGSDLTYGNVYAIVTGSKPMSMQWMFNGTTPVAANTAYNVWIYPNLTNVQYSDTGTYQLFVTNAFGATNSAPITLNVVPPLSHALDTTNWTWSFPWYDRWHSQTEITHDGADAVEVFGTGNGLETTVSGSNVFSFWFKIGSTNGFLKFDIDGAERWSTNGLTDWQQQEIALEPGQRTVRFRSEGYVWLDELVLMAGESPSIITHPATQTVVQGDIVNLSTVANGTRPLSYQWWQGNAKLSGATNRILTLTNIDSTSVGNYFVTVTNLFGTATSSNALLTLPMQQFITTVAGGGGTISPTPNLFLDLGSSQRFIASAHPDFVVANWYTNGVKAQTGGTTFDLLSVSTNYVVSVDFRPVAKLFWQHTNGYLAEWKFDGTNYLSSAALPSIGPEWQMRAQRDFNGDGSTDILFQDKEGRLLLRTMIGATRVGDAFVRNGKAVPSGWRLKAVLDLNEDGNLDLLLDTSANNRLAVWFMNNGTNFLSSALLQSHSVHWNLVGAADFDFDGHQDLLWQHDGGYVAVWIMNGTNRVRALPLHNGQAAGRSIRALVDLDGNGQSDIVLQNTKGQLSTWLMNGTNHLGTVLLREGKPAAAVWKLKGPN